MHIWTDNREALGTYKPRVQCHILPTDSQRWLSNRPLTPSMSEDEEGYNPGTSSSSHQRARNRFG